MTLPRKTLRTTLRVLFLYLPAISLMTAGLLGSSGCGTDLTGILTTDATLADLAGTWTGTLTENSVSQNFQFVIDSLGNFTAADGTIGTATITTTGTVTFSYVSSGYNITLKGTMNSAKTKITMSTHAWSGTSSGSAAFTGTLAKAGSSSGTFALADLVGTWAGTMTENGQAKSYTFTVDSSGNFDITGGVSGTATISSSGTVIFTYTSGDYTGTYQGSMNSAKTQIVMSTHTWAGTSSGSASFTGTLAKSSSSADDFALSDLVGTWTGTLTENATSQNYQFTVDSSGNFTAGDSTTGTATITTGGVVAFTYVANGYTITLKGTMNSGRTKIVMSTSSWTGTATGSAAFTGTLTKT